MAYGPNLTNEKLLSYGIVRSRLTVSERYAEGPEQYLSQRKRKVTEKHQSK